MEKEVFEIGQIVKIDLKKLRNDRLFKYLGCFDEDLDQEIIYGEIQRIFPGVKETYTIKEIKEFDIYNRPVYGRIFMPISDRYIIEKTSEKYVNIRDIIKEMHMCEDDQTNHFVSKLKPGDRVLVRVSYFMYHHICVPALFNRYGTISEIKYEGYCEPTGINVSYNVKMDSGINLTINDPTDLIRIPIGGHGNGIKKVEYQPYQQHYYDSLNTNTYTKDLISDIVNKAKKFIAKEFNIKEEKQMDNMPNMSIDKVIFNDPATIILWKSWHWEKKVDNSVYPPTVTTYKVQDKTVVKCAKGEKFNKYNGFCAAVTKRIFETNSAIQHIIREAQDDSDAKKLVQEIVNTGKKVKAQRENMKETKKK